MSQPKSDDKSKQYGSFLRSLSLNRIYLRRAKHELFLLKKMPKKPIEIQFSLEAKCSLDEKKLIVLDCFQLIGGPKDSKRRLFMVEGDFGVEYSLKKIPSKKTIDEFLKRHHTFHVWPYIREFIQNATARMELPPLTLPLRSPPPARPKK